eukprot:538261-Pyramimonas_sp.AAC.2
MQFYYWLSTVSEYHWSSTRVPLLQYYCMSTVLGLLLIDDGIRIFPRRYCRTLTAGSSSVLPYDGTTRARHLQRQHYNGTARLRNSTALSLNHYR